MDVTQLVEQLLPTPEVRYSFPIIIKLYITYIMPNVLLKKTKIKKKRSGMNNFKNSRGLVHNRELSTGTYPFTV